jgi:hypothetical protein
MPQIQNLVTVAANATNDNVLTGSQFEYLPYPAYLEFAGVGAATGLLMDIYSGSDILCEGMAPSQQNRVPVYPDDYSLTDVAGAGERLKLRVRNTTGAGIVFFYSVRITPL